MDNEKDTILYVDDEEANLFLFEVTFSEEYNVLTTLSTAEAREMLTKHEVKVVFSDLRMPEESGIDFINSVSPLYPDIYYIILTAFLDIDAAMKAINFGNIHRYLLKPWNVNEIKVTISNAILTYNLKKENKLLFDQLQETNRGLVSAMAQVKERELQFYNIFYFSTDGIIIFDKNGHILLSNPAFNNFLGFSGAEDVNLRSFLKGESLRQFELRMHSILEHQPASSIEYEISLSGNEIKYIEANSSLIDYSGEKVFLSILRDITERKQMENKIINAVINAEERERNRLASDLHDGLGPILSTIKMYIEWLSDKSRTGNADQILDLSNKTIQEAIAQLRAISHNISPHILEKFGLLPALQSQVDLIKPTSPLDFKINSELKERISGDIEIALFRIVKECINNTMKHSGAKKVCIDITKETEVLKLTYTDDGFGFDTETVFVNNKGMGLYNMKNRVKSLGGEIEIQSQPGKGTSVRITIVLN